MAARDTRSAAYRNRDEWRHKRRGPRVYRMMALSRGAWIGIGMLGFVGALSLIMPPTTPVGANRSAAQRPASATPPAPPPAPIYPDIGISDAPGAVRRPADPIPPLPHQAEVGTMEDSAPAANEPPVPTYEQLDAAYRAGYRWAAREGVEDRRECRRWSGSPQEEGCRAFVRDARRGDSEEATEDEPFTP